jgi:hypothetical protein
MVIKRFGLGLLAGATLSLWLSDFLRGQGSAGKTATEEHAAVPAAAVAIQMRNVNYRLANDIALEVRSLRGDLIRTKPEEPVTFDDSSSFKVAIDTAEVAISPESMANLMNSYVLGYKGAPFKDVSLTIEGNKLKQKGTVHKGLDVKFEIEGSLSVTADGNIRMHAEKIKANHIPVKGLLHFLGEDLSKLVNKDVGHGMKIEGDDVILMPSTLTPPPHMEGRVTRVAIQNGKIVQYFDSGKHLHALKPPFATGAYIYHRGGVLRFGKLTMHDADLEIVGDRPALFDFYQKEYEKQLVAGYSKTTAEKGLVAHMFDYSHFRSRAKQVVTGSRPASATRSSETQRPAPAAP